MGRKQKPICIKSVHYVYDEEYEKSVKKIQELLVIGLIEFQKKK